jgi:hypothetical protein
MSCPICDQKPMNCDCTPRERAMWLELQELEDRPAVVLTDAEREAIEWYAGFVDGIHAATLRNLLERLGGGG